MYRNFGKAIFDLFVASLSFILLFPFLCALSFLLMISNGTSIFFVQSRIGLREKSFNLIKFKTMNDKTGPDGILLPDRDRLTTIGSFLRKFSLDELPQLINILKGEMSIVGPRPLLKKYIPLYSSEQKRRHDTKPGITGLAQINGRNNISWTQKFSHDVFYVDNITFIKDLQIIWMTAIKVIKREGVDLPSGPFTGDN